MKMYPTLEAYYAEDPECRWSGEADYGVHWRMAGWEQMRSLTVGQNVAGLRTDYSGSGMPSQG